MFHNEQAVTAHLFLNELTEGMDFMLIRIIASWLTHLCRYYQFLYICPLWLFPLLTQFLSGCLLALLRGFSLVAIIKGITDEKLN